MKQRKIYGTRLPSNLRSTTRECVHLVTHGHFRSRDKDGGHIRHIQKPHDTRRPDGSIFYRTGVMADQSSTLHQ